MEFSENMKFDVVVIGGGTAGYEYAMSALNKGFSCALVSKGRSLDNVSYRIFVDEGGVLLMGDSAIRADISNSKVERIYTLKLGSTPLVADEYVLATGRFFGGGLVSDMNGIREPVFGLDVRFQANPSSWFNRDFFDRQPFEEFGVITDSEGHPFINGVLISNLIVKGGILASKQSHNAGKES